jgi:uncharacterized repeat protein (TIGR01451 family)
MKKVLLTLLSVLLPALAGTAAGSTCPTDTAQADFQAGVASNLDLTSSPGNVKLATSGASGGTVDQQNTMTTLNGDAFTNTVWTGQTFTAHASGALTKVDVNLFCSFCTIGVPPAIIVSIRAASGGLPTGGDLASSSLNITNYATGGQAFFSATFAAPTNITSGNQYAIVIHASAAYGTSGKNLGFSDSAANASQGGDVYGGGSLIHSTNGGTSWNVIQYSVAPTTSDGGFRTYVGGNSGYNSIGDLISSMKDSNPPAGTSPTWSTLSWTSVVPTSTAVKFQAAASNSLGGPFNFVGPDGTSGTYFTTTNASLSQFNGSRYLKYRSFLSTSNSSSTPVLNDATVCYSSEPLSPTADLSITNSDGQTSKAAGASTTYNIQATNSGPSDITGATVTDTFPAVLSCTWTCTGSGGGTCPAPASGSGNINASVNLPNGGHANFVAVCSIVSSATGTLANTASINAPAGATDPDTSNNSATDSESLVIQPDIAVTITDSVNKVAIGTDVNYVIRVTNAGPSDAAVNVTDAMPTQLSSGSWVCSATGGASCSNKGNGNTMNTNATVPVGGVATYTYTATVTTDDAGDDYTNTATVRATNGTDPNSANNSASDSDTIVLFLSGFEGSGTIASNVAGGVGSASVTIKLGVDAGLLNTLGAAPVTIASGHSTNGRKLFSLQLMRLGGDIAMRTLTTIDDTAFSDVSPWQVVDLKQHVISLQWQSATARGDDGYLRTGPATQQVLTAANNARESLTQLQVATENQIPWLVLIEP